MKLEEYHEYGKYLVDKIRLKSYPLAIKMLVEEEIPSYAKNPREDFGHRLSLCQAFQISRREGTTIAMLKEDNWCFEPVIGYGFEKPTEYFMEGHNRYPHDVETLDAGKVYAKQFPKLESDRYKGIMFAPLRSTEFEPDVITIYCDSLQLSLLLLGREYKKGYNLKCELSSHAACVYGIVPVIKGKECQVAIPCRGDRYHAMAESEEIIFSVPNEKFEDLIEGLKHVEETGSKLPHGRTIRPEYPLPKSYRKAAEEMEYFELEKEKLEEKESPSSWHD